jgi:hypothetical protein
VGVRPCLASSAASERLLAFVCSLCTACAAYKCVLPHDLHCCRSCMMLVRAATCCALRAATLSCMQRCTRTP